METAESQRAVLDVNRMTLFTEGPERGQYANAHFALYSGQLALVRLNKLQETAAFADVFSGLLPPANGNVRFLNRDWMASQADTANAMRGKIGRVFSGGGWLDAFNLVDNILLSERHHTRRSEDVLWREAVGLAELFRLPGLPTGYPGDYSRADLQRAACVRAFMGNPLLVLLEDPTVGRYQGMLPALVNIIRRVRKRGAAVWWMTLSDDVWRDESIPADRFFRISGRELMEVNRSL